MADPKHSALAYGRTTMPLAGSKAGIRDGLTLPELKALAACPACGSDHLTRIEPALATRLLAYASLNFPVSEAFRRIRTCKACGHTMKVS